MLTNEVTDICFIAPTEKLALKAKNIIEKRNDDIKVFVAALDDAKNLCGDLINKGAKIFISRKGTKSIIENNFNINVVGINITLSDYVDILKDVRNLNGPVGFFSYEEMVDGIKPLCDLLNIEARHYRFTNNEDSERCILDAIKDGVVFGIGGSVTGRYAKKHNFNHVIIENSEEQIISAIDTANQLLLVMKEELKKQEDLKIMLERYESIFNYTHDGIIAIDDNKKITLINKEAERLIDKSGEPIIGNEIENIIKNTRMIEVLNSGKKELDQVMNINNLVVNTNRIPIVVDKKVKGVVATFQDVKVIQNSEMKIRLKMYDKGLVAKYNFNDIIGKSKIITYTKTIAKRFAQLESTVLIYGETGTGKELFAQSIHNSSKRKNSQFVAINCATLPKDLLASELFGYVEGAFTGATKGGKPGLFEIAHKGTIFLDEIADIPIDIQGQLLRVLQEKEIRRIGSDSVTPVDIRVIAATNKPLEIEVAEKRFREDLYFRLNILNISIPPLRDRREDIETIGLSMFKAYTKDKYTNYKESFIKIMESINGYNWPGNVRELNNFVERISAQIEIYSADEIIQIVKQKYNNNNYLANIRLSSKSIEDEPINFESWEYNSIIEALKRNKFVVSRTSSDLGISRSTLIRKMKKYNIQK